ncbi:hypothetical protein GCM10022268_36690 [Sphingomonas cynarae]|uniref:Uncharacterized protein n=2 Tax=Sphingomonas cynarae TaxID=930197 RepID=A0ABP7F0M3_9SPHN
MATAVAELNIVPAGIHAYRITQRSTIRLEPLDYLSNLVPMAVPGATYDGRTNYIGPTPADTCRLIEHQHRYAAAMVDELGRCLEDALPETTITSEESIRLRRAELCRDEAVDDPLDATLLLCHSVVQGTRWLERSVYRAGAAGEQGCPVARWWRQRKGAAYKVYAKAAAKHGDTGALRKEVACQGRKALQQLGCGQRPGWAKEDVTALLIEFITAALPLLDTLDSHVRDVLGSSIQPSDLFVALSPLVLPMSGAPTGGRPTSREQVAQLRYAFDSIVLTGQYRGKGLRKGVTMRSLLDELCDSGGPLEKHPSLCLYMLKPQFVRASRAFATGEMGAERVTGSNLSKGEA